MNSTFQTFVKLISAQGMWGAVIATITFILLGYFATKSKIFTKEINSKISKFTIVFVLPFLTLWAFMVNTDKNSAVEIGIVLGISVAFYGLFAIVTWFIVNYFPKLIPNIITKKAEKLYDKAENKASEEGITLARYKDAYLKNYQAKLMTVILMIAYGSLQFFAVPLVIATQGVVFNKFANAMLQVWNIPYMIGAFSYVMIMYSGEKITKKHIKPVLKQIFSPMMCCLYISLLLWSIQWIPGANKWFIIDPIHPYSVSFKTQAEALAASGGKPVGQFWGAFVGSLPAIGSPLVKGVSLVSPLAWLVIGGSLAVSSVKKAVKDWTVWATTAFKQIAIPLVMFGVAAIFVSTGLFSLSTAVLMVLLAATPPAAVCVIYSVAYNHPHTGFTSQVSTLTTLTALIAMPIWIIISYVTFSAMGAKV